MRYLLNTNHAVALLNSDVRIVNRLDSARLSGSTFGITTIALGELFFGAYHGRKTTDNIQRIQSLVLPNFDIYDFDVRAAEEFGRIQAELRAIGRPIPVADVQIAAVGRLHDMTVLTSDAHFRVVNNLRVEDWLISTA